MANSLKSTTRFRNWQWLYIILQILYVSLNKTDYWPRNKLKLQDRVSSHLYCYRSLTLTCYSSTPHLLTDWPYGFIALMYFLVNKTKCFRGLKPLSYHEKRWKQRIKIFIDIFNSNDGPSCLNIRLNYPVTRENSLAVNYFVYSLNQLNFNVSISKEKRFVNPWFFFRPEPTTRAVVNCFY